MTVLHETTFLFFCTRLFLDSKSAQTDEEKQRERQRNEREQKHAEIDAANKVI